MDLRRQLDRQLDPKRFWVKQGGGRVTRLRKTYYLPDVYVVSIELTQQDRSRWHELDVYPAPLPLVIEIWSPTTGGYDVRRKLPRYQQRGDQEIWLVHPYERTVSVWQRQPDGGYQERFVRNGMLRPVYLPNVDIDLDTLFD
jgi:Uma2 family endonuclease